MQKTMSKYLFSSYTYLDNAEELTMISFYTDIVKLINTNNQKTIQSMSYKEFQKNFCANTFYDIDIEE